MRIDRILGLLLCGMHAGLQQMTLAAAGFPPHIKTALAAASAVVAKQGKAQRREQFQIATRDEILQRRLVIRRNIKQ